MVEIIDLRRKNKEVIEKEKKMLPNNLKNFLGDEGIFSFEDNVTCFVVLADNFGGENYEASISIDEKTIERIEISEYMPGSVKIKFVRKQRKEVWKDGWFL